MELKLEKLDLDSLDITEVEVLSMEDTMGMAEGQASFLPSSTSTSSSVIATSTSSI